MRYEVVRQDDPVLRERLKELAKARRRFGYRRLHVFLRREGHEVSRAYSMGPAASQGVARARLISQAAGAVYGAALAVVPPKPDQPVIGMLSYGSSALKYMVYLRQPLVDRGFSVAVFHGTGMGGMAMESLAEQGYFACVLELAVAEIGNIMVGSVVNAGANRVTAAGQRGTPSIAAPGFGDMIDFPTWAPVPERFRDRPYHAHNRLIASASLTGPERRDLAREVARRLKPSTGPVHFVLPTGGVHAWDTEGMPAHDPEALAEMVEGYRAEMADPIQLSVLDCHINDEAFSIRVLEIIDGWIADGTIKMTRG